MSEAKDIKTLAHELVLDSKPHILMYLRDDSHNKQKTKDGHPAKGKPIGLVLTYIEDNKIYLGWSKCNTTEDDFNRYKGVLTAYSKKRATELGSSDLQKLNNVPSVLLPLLNKVIDITKKKVETQVWKLK